MCPSEVPNAKKVMDRVKGTPDERIFPLELGVFPIGVFNTDGQVEYLQNLTLIANPSGILTVSASISFPSPLTVHEDGLLTVQGPYIDGLLALGPVPGVLPVGGQDPAFTFRELQMNTLGYVFIDPGFTITVHEDSRLTVVLAGTLTVHADGLLSVTGTVSPGIVTVTQGTVPWTVNDSLTVFTDRTAHGDITTTVTTAAQTVTSLVVTAGRTLLIDHISMDAYANTILAVFTKLGYIYVQVAGVNILKQRETQSTGGQTQWYEKAFPYGILVAAGNTVRMLSTPTVASSINWVGTIHGVEK